MATLILHAQGERGFLDVEPHLWLRPGSQDIDPETLRAHMGTESFRAAVDRGMVEIVSEVVEVERRGAEEEPEVKQEEETEAPLPETLEGMNTRDAAILIMQTDDVETLENWALEDNRATVLRAIERRLDALK